MSKTELMLYSPFILFPHTTKPAHLFPLSNPCLSKQNLGTQAKTLGVILDSTFFLTSLLYDLLSLLPDTLSNPSLQTYDGFLLQRPLGLKEEAPSDPSPADLEPPVSILSLLLPPGHLLFSWRQHVPLALFMCCLPRP